MTAPWPICGVAVDCFDCGGAYSLVSPAIHVDARMPEPEDRICVACLFQRNMTRIFAQ